ncbi:MAG: 3,5-cyclic adenosine monophosphate phosphodiesterase CpdA [Betaproteobacteria bacterium]|nr:3,5-cyclic adenosine monophosphate phosphodiesterase CpdA [Betaproteobacteria bacterium]
MKLHILSDLHIEFSPFAPADTGADVVILAGDIHKGGAGLTWARAAFPRQELIYVVGNHEFYGGDWERTLVELRALAASLEIHLLEDDELLLGGVRFLGTALWTDFDFFGRSRRREAMRACVEYLTDFRLIGAAPESDDCGAGLPVPNRGLDRLTPAHVRRRHLASRAWLEQRLESPSGWPTVVITHHLPGAGSVASRYRDDLGNAGFASHLDHLMGPAALWVHGHTHDSFDYRKGGTRVVCNPRGYPTNGGGFENPRFNPELVLEL